MDDSESRRIGALTIAIDRLLCVGFGDCIDVAPEAFELDEEGIATFRADADQVDESTVVTACEECPVDALAVFDEEGHQLHP